MTQAELTALKTLINSDVTNQTRNEIQITQWVNDYASPDWWVYRTSVPVVEVGDAINASELAGLTALNLQRLQAMTGDLSGGTIHAANADRRAGFDSVFSGAGGATTRANLAVVWRRKANRFEKQQSTGTGSTGSPATMTWEGSVTTQNVVDALTKG